MCDETTEAENQIYHSNQKAARAAARDAARETVSASTAEVRALNRREWNLGTGATVAALLTGCPSPSSKEPAGSLKPESKEPESAAGNTSQGASHTLPGVATKSRTVAIETPDGSAEAFFVAPQDGRHPAVLLWPDVAGLRAAFETMASRLAGQGYAVLSPNPYYRSSKLPILDEFSKWQTDEGKAKIAPMRDLLTPEAVTRDAIAYVEWLDQQPEVDPQKKMGSAGYCMSGSYALRTAAAKPERVGVAASFHGGGLVTDDPSSPHVLFDQMKAFALLCIAQNDDARQPDAKTKLGDAAQEAGITTEIEVYPAQHGWTVLDSPVYDEPQAEKAWSRLLDALKTL